MMPRQVLIRVMLGSLGVAAVCGVLAVLLGGEKVIAQFTGTAISTAVACLLMLGVSRMTRKEPTRLAGVVGMWAVVVEFVLVNVLIWGGSGYSLGWRFEEMMFFTIAAVGWTSVAGVMLLRKLKEPAYRLAARVGLWVCGMHLGLGLAAIWGPFQRWDYRADDKLWMSAWLLFAAGLTIVAAMVGVGVEKGRWWRWVGVVSGVVAFGIGLAGVWYEPERGGGWFAVFASVAVLTAHANLLIRCVALPGAKWLVPATIGSAVVVAMLIDFIIVFEPKASMEEPMARLAGAFGVLTGCGTLALTILAGLHRTHDREMVAGAITELTLICPRCEKKQAVPIGQGACASCGLRIHIEVQEPRCPTCDYLLYKLTSDRCPECGTAIPTPKVANTPAAV